MLAYFIKKEISSNLIDLKAHRDFTDFSELMNVVIIYELADYEQSIELESTFSSYNCSVKLLGYNADKKRTHKNENGYLFSPKELTILGKPNCRIIAEFNKLTTNCNLIIDITRGKFLPINYLLSQKKSVFKVGIEVSEFKLYDFIFQVQKNVDAKFLCEQIMFYLRKLKSQRLRLV